MDQHPAPLIGLLLLTGGKGSRMGEPKYAIPHPEGGSWAGHLVRVFEEAFPDATLRILGNPVPERPELRSVEDPRQGPAIALRSWAIAEDAQVDWWWIAACDQVRWHPEALKAWFTQATAGGIWTLGSQGGRFQPMGSWFPGSLLPLLASTEARSVHALLEHLPHRLLEVTGQEWLDLDTPEERQAWELHN
nr:NTP transferase domain-containing protein [uncultured Holophaga sp.]